MATSPSDTILLSVIIFILLVSNYAISAIATEYSADYQANIEPDFLGTETAIAGGSPGVFTWIDTLWNFLVIVFGVLVWTLGAPAWVNLLILMPIRIAGYMVLGRVIRGVGS